MPDLTILTLAAGVAVLWLFVGLVVARWGPGVNKRLVRCPETKSLARISVLYKESSFGAVRANDVVECSLLGAGPVTCDKHCLTRV